MSKRNCYKKDKNVSITEFCLRPQPSEDESLLEEVGAVLLCALHNELVKREYKRISWVPEAEVEKNYVRKLFHNFGYTSGDEDWVWMFKIVNLPMLLGELSPLLSKRLNESDDYKGWQGTMSIKGSEHRASLIIKDGEIRVSEEIAEGTGICLSTDDDTITRFILGVITPYGAHLQDQLHIAPTVNDSGNTSVGDAFSKALETHHCSNERCITPLMLKQIRGSTVPCKNDNIEAEPIASVDGLNFKNTSSQVRTV